MSLAKQAGKAGALMLFRKGWGAIVNIGTMAYLARTLDTSDFGLVAISGTLISFIQLFGISGISEYAIFYNGNDQKKVLNSAFWLNLWLTIGIISVCILIMPFWASWYSDIRIKWIVALLLIGFFFTSIGSIPVAIFRKELNYGPLITIQTVFGTISQLSTVLFAALGFGVYSLALPAALVVPFMSITLFWKSGFRPTRNNQNRRYWKDIFSYTKHIIGARILNKLANEGDTLLVGKFLGMEALGIYDIAFKLANIINSHLLPIVTNIALPVFSKASKEISKVRSGYLQITKVLAFIFFPIHSLMILAAPDIINILYGDKWLMAILPFQIFLVFAAFRSISSSSSGLFNSLNKPQYLFYFNLVYVPIILLVILYASTYDLLTIVLSVTCLRVLGGFVQIYLATNLIDLKFKSLLENIGSTLIISLLMTLPVIFYSKIHKSIFEPLLIGIIYFMVYFAINLMFNSKTLKSILNILHGMHPTIEKLLNNRWLRTLP